MLGGSHTTIVQVIDCRGFLL